MQHVWTILAGIIPSLLFFGVFIFLLVSGYLRARKYQSRYLDYTNKHLAALDRQNALLERIAARLEKD